jgi:hypothetical protein
MPIRDCAEDKRADGQSAKKQKNNQMAIIGVSRPQFRCDDAKRWQHGIN